MDYFYLIFQVFYDLILAGSVGDGSIIGVLLGYPIWALVTIGVLLCMDSMECFLHALRLHWY
jgi:V-type H+-transporting ATPase subunit a